MTKSFKAGVCPVWAIRDWTIALIFAGLIATTMGKYTKNLRIRALLINDRVDHIPSAGNMVCFI